MTMDPGSRELMRGVDVRDTRLWHNARAAEIGRLRVELDMLKKQVAATYRVPAVPVPQRPHPFRVYWAPSIEPSGSGDPAPAVWVHYGEIYWYYHWMRGVRGDQGWLPIGLGDITTGSGWSAEDPLDMSSGTNVYLVIERTPSQSGNVTNDTFTAGLVTDDGVSAGAWNKWVIRLASVYAGATGVGHQNGTIVQRQFSDIYLRDDPAPGTLQFCDPNAFIPDGWEDVTDDYLGFPRVGSSTAPTYEAGATEHPTKEWSVIRKL